MKRVRWCALALLVVLTGAACGSDDGESDDDGSPVTITSPSASTFRGATYEPARTLPDVSLIDTDGRPWNLADKGKDRVTVVYFGYTNCPDVCPTDVADLATARRELTPSEQQQVDLVFVTVDVRRDTRPVLRRWLERFDPQIVGLTGMPNDISAAARALGVPYRVTAEGEVQEVEHGSQMTAFSREGTSRLLWLSGTSPDTISHDLRLLLDGVTPS